MFFKAYCTALVAAAALLAGCGGGGGGGPPTLTVSPASITVNASSEDASVDEVYLQLTVARMPEAGVWVAVQSDGDAVQLAEFVNAEGQTGEVHVVLKQPLDVGVGEYGSTVTISVCRDEMCSMHIANSPALVPVALTVTDPPDAAPLVDRHALEHDVVDAEYSEALDAIVMVSNSPTPALYLYDPVAQTAQSIALDAAPQAVSVGPDGLSAAVGHDGMITVVDLASMADATVLDLSTDVGDIVLAGNGYVHALPRTVDGIRSVEIATNTETTQAHPAAFDGTKAKLHPGGAKMYGANNGVSPDNIERYDIAAGVAASDYSSPYGGIHEMCGDLWMHEQGLHIYTACGNVFRPGEEANRTMHADRRDMLYAGTLDIPGADDTFNGRRIRSLSHSAESHELALLDEVAPACDPNPVVCSTLRLYDVDYLDLVAQYRLLPVKVDGVNYRQRGVFVLHSADGAARYLVSQLQPSGGYLVSTLGVPAHEPDLSPPPAPTVTASLEAGITAAPLTAFAALPHDVVDAAFSTALNAVVMLSTYPESAVHVRDVTTGADRSIALTKVPASLSLSPDGMSASVGHTDLITIVDLAPGGAAPTLLPTTTPGWTVMGGNGFVYVTPSAIARIRSINIATGVETQGSAPVAIGAYTTARLHPAGSKMYGFDTVRGELTSFPIVLGIADYGTHSPYLPNEHPMCGDQWFSESGAMIYTACGNTFAASDTPSEDMLFVGTLELTDAENFTFRVDSLDESADAQEVALIEYTRIDCMPGQGLGDPCYSHLNLYDSTSLARDARYSFSPLSVGTRNYPQQGRFVFHSADGTQRHVISQLLEMPNPDTEFYISRLP